jgi:hypothetical protein
MKKKLVLVTKVDDIPDSFGSEDDERDWWATHELSDDVVDQLQEGVAEANQELKRFQEEFRRNHAWARRRAV